MIEKPPTISVIIPTYNRAHLVGRAIRSVLAQTYQDFELIIVDDASTDDTGEVVKDFDDDRIRYMRHDENRGGSAARNTGIRASRGEYIAFLDSDDEWLERKLEKQVDLFAQLDPLVGVIYCKWYVMDDATRFVRPANPSMHRRNVWHQLLRGWSVPLQSSLVRREAIEGCGGFDESLPSHQEIDLWLQIGQHYHFDYVDQAFAVIHFHQGYQITTDFEAGKRGLELLLGKWAPTIKKEIGEGAYERLRRRRLSTVYARGVMGNLRTSQRKRAWKSFIKLVHTRHVPPKTLVKLVLALIAGPSVHDHIRNIWRSIRWKTVSLEEIRNSQSERIDPQQFPGEHGEE